MSTGSTESENMALTHEPDPKALVARTEHWAVCLNRSQDLLGRCYLLLLRPETDALALTPEELSAIWSLAGRVRGALTSLWEPDHFNFAFLMNVDPQVHFHVLPRYRIKREWVGGTFVDPTFGGHYNVAPDRLLEDDAFEAIRTALARTLL